MPSVLGSGAYIIKPVLIAERHLTAKVCILHSGPKMYDPVVLSLLHEFDNILKPIKRSPGNNTSKEENLKVRGIERIGSGAFKTVYKYKNYAVCIVKANQARRERLVRNLQYMLRNPMKRDIFVYPCASFFSIELDIFYIGMELCSHDMFYEMFTMVEPIMEDPKQLSKQVKKIISLFTQDNFLHRLSNEITSLHAIEDDEKGIFNFDIKFENFFVLHDSLRLGDIDGFGMCGKLLRFGTHTDTWCLSLYGGKGTEYENTVSKRLGCMNDLTAFALLALFIRVMAIDYQSFIKCYKENALLTYGNKDGMYTNSKGQRRSCLKNTIYKSKQDKSTGKNNLIYVRKRAEVIIYLFKKYAITAEGYSQPFENIIQAFEDISTLRFLCVENELSSNDVFIHEYVKLKQAIFHFLDNTRDTFDVLRFRSQGKKRMRLERVTSTSSVNCCFH